MEKLLVFEEEKTFRRRRYILTSPKVPSQTPVDQHLKVSVQRVLGDVGIYLRRLRSNIRRRTYIPPSPKVPSQTIVDHHLNVTVSKGFGRRMLFPSSRKLSYTTYVILTSPKWYPKRRVTILRRLRISKATYVFIRRLSTS